MNSKKFCLSFIFIFFWPKTNAEFVEASLIPVPNEILFDHEADLVEKEKHLKKLCGRILYTKRYRSI